MPAVRLRLEAPLSARAKGHELTCCSQDFCLKRRVLTLVEVPTFEDLLFGETARFEHQSDDLSADGRNGLFQATVS
jgi:hypothetical protein